jgi:selenoprotein W-related protein
MEQLLDAYELVLDQVVLQPSSGGRFEITVGNDVAFSKAQQGRFPEENEVVEAVGRLLENYGTDGH